MRAQHHVCAIQCLQGPAALLAATVARVWHVGLLAAAAAIKADCVKSSIQDAAFNLVKLSCEQQQAKLFQRALRSTIARWLLCALWLSSPAHMLAGYKDNACRIRSDYVSGSAHFALYVCADSHDCKEGVCKLAKDTHDTYIKLQVTSHAAVIVALLLRVTSACQFMRQETHAETEMFSCSLLRRP